jgi:uncharacterized membrane protein YsdA (DUF1294 family)
VTCIARERSDRSGAARALLGGRGARIMRPMLPVCWTLVLVVNLVTIGVYAFDKLRSRRQGRRVSERALLWWLFATGWIGAWVAMSWFRHKTAKASFRRWAMLWTIVNPFWPLLWWTLRPA